ncbi:hypothetical protein BJ546DRAFT_66427 [Cryomyces antarcticus]
MHQLTNAGVLNTLQPQVDDRNEPGGAFQRDRQKPRSTHAASASSEIAMVLHAPPMKTRKKRPLQVHCHSVLRFWRRSWSAVADSLVPASRSAFSVIVSVALMRAAGALRFSLVPSAARDTAATEGASVDEAGDVSAPLFFSPSVCSVPQSVTASSNSSARTWPAISSAPVLGGHSVRASSLGAPVKLPASGPAASWW